MRVCKATGGAVQTSVNNLTPEIVGSCDLMEEVPFTLPRRQDVVFAWSVFNLMKIIF